MTDHELPDSIAANVADWTETNAQFTDEQAARAWQPQELTWGVFNVREDSIGSPLDDLAGLDVGQWPAEEIWVARRHNA